MTEIVKDRQLQTTNSRKKSTDYPFATMEIGDSFHLKEGSFERKKFSVMIHSVGKRLGVKSSTKSGANGLEDGLWCQRVS